MAAMTYPEQIHRYPRFLRLAIELLSVLAVGLAAFQLGKRVLQYFWYTRGVDSTFFDRFPALQRAVARLEPLARDDLPESLMFLMPQLVTLLLALLATLMLRNAFPTIRTSSRGMLIEFANGWLPVNWNEIETVKVTGNPSQASVLLLETRGDALTDWHRFYSFLYSLSLGRGLWVSSSVGEFGELYKTVLEETDRVSDTSPLPKTKVKQNAKALPLLLLTNPVGFFSLRAAGEKPVAKVQRPTAAVIAAAPPPEATGIISATYPDRIRKLILGAVGLLGLLLLLRYLTFWGVFIFREWRSAPDFLQSTAIPTDNSLWLLIAAHLMLAAAIPLLVVLYTLLPELQVRPQGLAVRGLRGWHMVPWEKISMVRASELGPNIHVVLVETDNDALPWWHAVSGLLFNGETQRGVLLTSAISNFEPLLQQVILMVSRTQRAQEFNEDEDEGIFRDDDPAYVGRLMVRPAEAIDLLVDHTVEDASTQRVDIKTLLRRSRVPVLLSLLPTLILFTELFIADAKVPTFGRIFVVFAFFIWGVLEWPIASLLAMAVENNPSFDAQQARPFYLYPKVQIPRLIPLFFALVITLVGIGFLPTLLWLGAIVWAFLLTAGLWEKMYDWHGPQLLGMGLIPSVFLFLSLLIYLALT